MTDDRIDDPLAALWQQQPVAPLEYDMERIIRDATTLDHDINARNRREMIAVWFVVATFIAYLVGAIVVGAHPLLVAACSVIIVGALFIAGMLRRYGRVRVLPDPGLDRASFVAAYRRTLLEQARLLRWAWLWYVGPIAVGLLLLDAGFQLGRGQPYGVSQLQVFFGAICLTIAGLNWAAAAKLKRQHRALDA